MNAIDEHKLLTCHVCAGPLITVLREKAFSVVKCSKCGEHAILAKR